MKAKQHPSPQPKHAAMPHNIKSAMRREAKIHEILNRRFAGAPQSLAADSRLVVDCTRLDLSAAIPGALRELGPAYLHVKVDRETGRIVDCCVRFGPDAAIASTADELESPYRPFLQSAAERALRRLLCHRQQS